MTPEMDLLDQLLGGNESLHVALQIFGWPDNKQALEQARHSISMQIAEGLIELKQRGQERALSTWEYKQVLNDDSSWMQQGEEQMFSLRLTEKGMRYIG
jgi:hypothetical protein